MHARTTIVRFRPDMVNEATRIIREIMLPSARPQQGFQGAYLFKSDTDAEKFIIISLWNTRADMLAAHPPEDIIPLLEPLDNLIAEWDQDTYETLFQLGPQA